MSSGDRPEFPAVGISHFATVFFVSLIQNAPHWSLAGLDDSACDKSLSY